MYLVWLASNVAVIQHSLIKQLHNDKSEFMDTKITTKSVDHGEVGPSSCGQGGP